MYKKWLKVTEPSLTLPGVNKMSHEIIPTNHQSHQQEAAPEVKICGVSHDSHFFMGEYGSKGKPRQIFEVQIPKNQSDAKRFEVGLGEPREWCEVQVNSQEETPKGLEILASKVVETVVYLNDNKDGEG